MRRGSSPLARGLRRRSRRQGRIHGIIPARAGFTNPRAFEKGIGRDHPRSRGVYRFRSFKAMDCSGSSPLARGLLIGRVRGLPRRRIIPARAGFTSLSPPRRWKGRDHPRSRGVYHKMAGTFEGFIGSSPLARGLPARDRLRAAHGRIIPARAGFTTDPTPTAHASKDHPRSRGVYVPFVPTQEQIEEGYSGCVLGHFREAI